MLRDTLKAHKKAAHEAKGKIEIKTMTRAIPSRKTRRDRKMTTRQWLEGAE